MEDQNNSLEVFLPGSALGTSLEDILARRYYRRNKSWIEESYRKSKNVVLWIKQPRVYGSI